MSDRGIGRAGPRRSRVLLPVVDVDGSTRTRGRGCRCVGAHEGRNHSEVVVACKCGRGVDAGARRSAEGPTVQKKSGRGRRSASSEAGEPSSSTRTPPPAVSGRSGAGAGGRVGCRRCGVGVGCRLRRPCPPAARPRAGVGASEGRSRMTRWTKAGIQACEVGGRSGAEGGLKKVSVVVVVSNMHRACGPGRAIVRNSQ
jgi:hypothetical protein